MKESSAKDWWRSSVVGGLKTMGLEERIEDDAAMKKIMKLMRR